MSEIDKLKSAADILTQVDITDIITNMGIGIAKAQEKLDNNSIKQALALADPDGGIGGKSLLELGFVPSFYSFQYADVSAEIELKMRLATEFEIGGSLSFDFTKQGGYSKEKLDFLRKDRDSRHRREFKSSRGFVTTSSNTEEITVLSNTVVMNESEGAIDRVEKFAEDIRSQTGVERVTSEIDSSKYQATNIISSASVNIKNLNGYIVITVPKTDTDASILKVSDYSVTATPVTYNSAKSITIGGTGNDTFTEVFDSFTDGSSPFATGTGVILIGYNHDTDQFTKQEGVSGTPVASDLELYFDFDKRDAEIAFDQILTDDDQPFTKDNTEIKNTFEILAKILKKDSSAKIKLYGYTDGKGSKEYNKLLSKDRTESLKAWFKGKGAKDDQIDTSNRGEDLAGTDQTPNLEFRKVTVEITSGADYFYLKNGVPSISATVSSAVAGIADVSTVTNGLIYTDTGSTLPSGTAQFTVDGIQYDVDEAFASFASSITSNATLNTAFNYNIESNTAYLLHNQSSIRYTAYSETEEEITIRTGSNTEENFESSDSEYLVDETTNTSTRIKKDSENIENPSTIAAGVSVSGSYSRKFSLEVSGNARVAARIVALPPPSQFIEEVKDIFNQ